MPQVGVGVFLGARNFAPLFGFPSPSLVYPLTSSLSPSVGSQALTFTRATTATYLDGSSVLQTASIGAARYPGNGYGYLAEPAATNLLLRSQELAFGGVWTTLGGTTTNDALAAPDGTTTAERVTCGAGSGAAGRYQTFSYTAAAHVLSCYLKAGTYNYAALDLSNGNNKGATFDLSDGTIGFTDASAASSIEAAGTWYRCRVTVAMTAVTGYPEFYPSATRTTNNKTKTWAGTETVNFWGAQLELAERTSYIPTTTAAVTRNADVLTIPAAALSQTQGTIYLEYTPLSITGTRKVFEGAIETSGSTLRANDGTNTVTGATVAIGTTYKVAISWTGSVLRICVNGIAAAGTFDGNMGLPTNVQIGEFGQVRNLKFYAAALTAAQLVTITT